MAKTVPVLLRVDRDAKDAAEETLAALDLTLSEAVSLFLHQVAAEGALPFSPKPRCRISVGAMEAMLEFGVEEVSAYRTQPEPDKSIPARHENEEERSLRRAVEASTSRAKRELTGVFRAMRPSIDKAPWWPEVD